MHSFRYEMVKQHDSCPQNSPCKKQIYIVGSFRAYFTLSMFCIFIFHWLPYVALHSNLSSTVIPHSYFSFLSPADQIQISQSPYPQPYINFLFYPTLQT